MKTLIYLFVLAVLVIAGCAKDDALYENPVNFELKNEKESVPFEANLHAVDDLNSDLILIEGLNPDDPASYSHSRLLISGAASHMGKIDPEKSYYTLEKIVFFMEDGQPFTLNSGTGIIVGVNGDAIEFTHEAKQSAIDGSYTGTIKIISGTGTGIFECCKGTISSVGGWSRDEPGIWSINEGYLVYE
jgi:hypothetical protein